MHCCLHLVGQIVSVGRLDQLLISYYKRDIRNGILTPERVYFDILLWSYHIRYTTLKDDAVDWNVFSVHAFVAQLCDK